jgi:hypothetical protein
MVPWKPLHGKFSIARSITARFITVRFITERSRFIKPLRDGIELDLHSKSFYKDRVGVIHGFVLIEFC